MIGSTEIGRAVALSDGTFTAVVKLGVPVGHYVITAQCGVTLTSTIDIALSSNATPPTETGVVLVIMLLFVIGLTLRQLSNR